MSKTKIVQDPVNQQMWEIRIIRQGEAYGLNDKLTHDSALPLVEFFSYEKGKEDKYFFVSRYYVETLLNSNAHGIQLDGRAPAFTLHEQAYADVLTWLREQCPDVVQQLSRPAQPLELL